MQHRRLVRHSGSVAMLAGAHGDAHGKLGSLPVFGHSLVDVSEVLHSARLIYS